MREGRFYKFWVYIIASPTGTLYIGMTGFIDTRIFQHKSGELDGFTKKYKCNRLVYYERYDDVYVAKRRERQLKGWRREKKIALSVSAVRIDRRPSIDGASDWGVKPDMVASRSEQGL